MSGSQVRFIRMQLGRVLTAHSYELNPQRRSNSERYLILDSKNIIQFPIVTLGPEMTSIERGDQLSEDANSSAIEPYAAFENVGNTQNCGYGTNVFLFPFKGERRSSRDNLQSGHAGQFVNDFFSQAIGEVFVVL